MGLYTKSWEALFTALLRFTAKVSENANLFLSACSFIILLVIGFFILYNVEEDQSAFWPVFLFITISQYFSTMNLLRQSLAMAVGCNAYTIMCKGRTVRNICLSLVLVFISTLFHKSGIVQVLLILPFLIKMDRRKIYISLIVAVIVFLAYPLFLRLFLIVIPKYARYIGGSRDIEGTGSLYTVIGAFESIMIILFCVFIDPEENQQSYRLLMISVFSLALISLRMRISLAVRLGYYFELFFILLIPDFYNKWKRNETKVYMKMGTYLLGWVYFIFSMVVHNARGCVPYSFFWQ